MRNKHKITVYIFDQEFKISDLPQGFCNKFGKALNQLLKDENVILSRSSEKHNDLSQMDLVHYLKQRDNNIISLILGMINKNTDFLDDVANINVQQRDCAVTKTIYKLCKSVESILYLAYVQAVFPTHLRESVLLHSVGSSKMSLTLLSSGSPHADYKTVKTWLGRFTRESKMSLEGDVVAGF